MELKEKILDEAFSRDCDPVILLRGCQILASQLDNGEFAEWVNREMFGYKVDDKLPEYRVISVEARGDFVGTKINYNYTRKVAVDHLSEEWQNFFCKHSVYAPISHVALVANAIGNDSYKHELDHATAHRIDEAIYSDARLARAYQIVYPAHFKVIVDCVIASVVRFVCSLGPDTLNPQNLAKQKAIESNVQQIFNTHVHGSAEGWMVGNQGTVLKLDFRHSHHAVTSELLAKILQAQLPEEAKAPAVSAAEELEKANDRSSFHSGYLALVGAVADHMQVLGPIVAPFLPALTALLK